jgi:ketosteroid isomerase-like protein
MYSAARVAAVAAMVSLIAASPLAAQCSPADRAALEALDKSWSDASTSGDRARMGSFVSDHYMGMNVAGAVDKQTMLANSERDAARARANSTPPGSSDRYLISCTPITATISHRNIFPDATTRAPAYSRSLHFMEKQGNTWKAVSSASHALTDQQQLVYLEQDWNDATMRHDADWTERNYASFATEISSRTGALEDKAQSMASTRADKLVYEAIDLSELATRVEGDVAVVTGVNRVRGKDAQGKAFDRRARFTDTFIKRDGRWQVWATQGTTMQ